MTSLAAMKDPQSRDLDLLLTTIDSSDLAALRSTLRRLVIASPDTARETAGHLLMGHGATLKARWATCENCEESFDVLNNGDEDCLYHSGDSKLNEDATIWDHWDERDVGPRDTSDNREELAEGFVWTCCFAEGDAEGCVAGPHVEKVVKKRKLSI